MSYCIFTLSQLSVKFEISDDGFLALSNLDCFVDEAYSFIVICNFQFAVDNRCSIDIDMAGTELVYTTGTPNFIPDSAISNISNSQNENRQSKQQHEHQQCQSVLGFHFQSLID
jgi:hypothetical protein